MRLIGGYTAKEIHSALADKNVALLESVIEDLKKEYITIPSAMKDGLNRLTYLGLSNTRNAKAIEEKMAALKKQNEAIKAYNDNIDFSKKRLEFIKETLETFGNNVMLVSYADFEHIILKYGLVCGLLEQYTGVIPEENIRDIERTREIMESHKSYTNKLPDLYFVRELRNTKGGLNEHKLSRVKIFPFATEINSHYVRRYNVISIGEITTNYHSDMHYVQSKLFIAAPKRDMDFSESFLDKIMPKPKDPFVCSYTDYGILIHTKWGEEAEDEVLKRYYKQLELI